MGGGALLEAPSPPQAAWETFGVPLGMALLSNGSFRRGTDTCRDGPDGGFKRPCSLVSPGGDTRPFI